MRLGKHLLTWLGLMGIVTITGLAFTIPQIPEGLFPEEFVKVLHPIDVMVVNSQGETSQIWSLEDNPDVVKLVILDLPRQNIFSEQLDVISNWVENHCGTAMIMSASYNGYFDFLGLTTGQNVSGSDRRFMSFESHPMMTGVTELWGNNNDDYITYSYSMIGADIPLFGWLDKNGSRVVNGAIKYHGCGAYLAMPSSINFTQYDGYRFWINVREFAAGFPAPPTIRGTVPSLGPGEFDSVILSNGGFHTGIINITSFTINSSFFGLSTFPVEQIRWIDIRIDTATVVLRNGDRISGGIDLSTIVIDDIREDRFVTLDVSLIKKIVFRENRPKSEQP